MSEDNEPEVYDDSIAESPEEQLSDGEISPVEEGFMKGYNTTTDSPEDEEDEVDKEFE